MWNDPPSSRFQDIVCRLLGGKVWVSLQTGEESIDELCCMFSIRGSILRALSVVAFLLTLLTGPWAVPVWSSAGAFLLHHLW